MLGMFFQSARVDCVKLQKSHLESRFTQERLNQWYRSRDAFGFNYRQHKEKLELSEEAYRELKEYASLRNLDFTASGMDKVHLI